MAGEPKIDIENGGGGMDKQTSFAATNLDGSPKFGTLDYFHAENMRVLSEQTNATGGRSPAVGNVFAGNIGTVVESFKGIRIYYEFTDGDDLGLSIIVYDGSGAVIYASPFSTIINGATYASDDVDTYLQSELSGAGIGNFTYAHNSGSNYTDATFDGGEWTIAFSLTIAPSSTPIIQQTAVITEYIDAGLTGNLQPIGSKELNGTTFFWSANKFVDGVGEIGVMTYNGTIYEYTRLLRSKNLKFGYGYLVDVDGEQNGNNYSFYYCDDYNVYRSFYYVKTGSFVEDSAEAVVDSNNFYELDSVALQSMLEPQAPYTYITLSSQTQTGGGLLAGNKRYAVVYVTPFGSESEVSPLSNPINVFTSNLSGTATLLAGSTDDAVTPKINILSLSGVNTSVFPKVRLLAVEYTNTAVSVKLIGTFDTSLNNYTVSHTGLEVATTLDATAVQDVQSEILHGLNIRIIDNRLVRSNYVSRPNPDLTDFAAALTFTTKILEVDSEQSVIDIYGVGMYPYGYFQPTNLNLYAGYMDNETYRFGVRGKWLNGGYTDVYWCVDKTITPSEDVTNYATNGVSLTTTHVTFDKLLVRHLVVDNITAALALLPVGISASDFEGFEIVRAACFPEVIATGAMYNVCKVTYNGSEYVIPFFYDSLYDTNTPFPITQIQSFISPNIILNGESINWKSGDVINYQNPSDLVDYNNQDYAFLQSSSAFAQTNGFTGAATDYTTDVLESVLNTLSYLNVPVKNTGGDYSLSTNKTPYYSTVIGNFYYLANFLTFGEDNFNYTWFYWNRLNTNNPILLFPSFTGATTYNFQPRIGQYFRKLTNKYGNPNTTIYQPIGCFFTTSATTADVFGGDTIIEKSCFKLGIMDFKDATNYNNVIAGLTFFTQNRIHSQMRFNGGTGAYVFPWQLPLGGGWTSAVGGWLEQGSQEAIAYSNSYTIRNNENAFAPYDTSIVYNNDYPARIDWSDSKPIGSLIDYYTKFRPLNYRDLDLKYGEIIHMDTANGELVTWQNYTRFQRQYFNNDATLNTLDTATVLVGDGSVMSRRGTEISNIGATHKWGVAKGRSKGGNDVFTWWNQKLGMYARFGYDGTIVLSDEVNMKRELFESTRAVDKTTTIITDWGTLVSSVWDDQNKEFLLTFRAWIQALPWEDGAYAAGQIVTTGNQTDYYGLPIYWRSLFANNTTDPENQGVIPTWESYNNNQTVAHFTLAFSEVTNRFTTYYSDIIPKLYFKWSNSFYTACPVNYLNVDVQLNNFSLYSHLTGQICEWWESENNFTYPIQGDVDSISPDFYTIYLNTTEPYFVNLPYKTWVLIVKYQNSADPVRYNVVSYTENPNGIITLESPLDANSVLLIETIQVASAFVFQPYIEYLVNQNPSANKRFHAIKINSQTEPLKTWFYTEDKESFIKNYYPSTISTPVSITVTALSGGNTILTSAGIKNKMGGFPLRTWYVTVEDPAATFTTYNVLGFPTIDQVTISGALTPPVTGYTISYLIPAYSDFLYENGLWTGSVRNDTTGVTDNTIFASRLKGKWMKTKVIFNTLIPSAIYGVITRFREQLRNYI